MNQTTRIVTTTTMELQNLKQKTLEFIQSVRNRIPRKITLNFETSSRGEIIEKIILDKVKEISEIRIDHEPMKSSEIAHISLEIQKRLKVKLQVKESVLQTDLVDTVTAINQLR